MNREDAEQLAQELLKPQLRRITVKCLFAIYLVENGTPYKIIAQEGEYCTFQELTAMEFEHFRQERLKHGI